jgi:DNA-directed RNA polymerase subunit M/transcription elongation factor TFIIS
MADTVGDCPNCGKRTFILHPTIKDGHKGLMGKCYNCGHEEWIDQGSIHSNKSTQNNNDFWKVDINPKWWF